MYTQNLNYLPNKKQSTIGLGGSIPHHLEFIKKITTKPFIQFEDTSRNVSVDYKTVCEDRSQENIVPSTNIMDLMYSFRDTSKSRSTVTTIPNHSERVKSNCKDLSLITQYSKMATMPMLSSQLVGGFVGSKSQIGRKPAYGFRLKMRDIIREYLLIGHPPKTSSIENIQKTDVIEENRCNMWKANETQHYSASSSDNCSLKHEPNQDQTKVEHCNRQSYADVAKAKSCKVRETPTKSITFDPSDNHGNSNQSKDCSMTNHMIEPVQLLPENNSNRNRFASDCSADSEDSFIVFEYCDDDFSVDGDSSYSDDELTQDSHSNEESSSNFGSVPSRKFSFNQCCNPGTKKVRFAEGKDLAQIHPMVTWDFAYRSARKGPWETLALDSERFKCRVARTEKILAPVLDPEHRATVYRLRFSPSSSS
uniref:Uncharacterized protein n=1 Tax=Homalodisca liturata TaxID=320908 RepID=A0A1B6IL55_9HEMI